MNDIEDFTTDQLRDEIRRREEAYRQGMCWYCGRNLKAHTCKHAASTPCPGWVFDPPRYVRDEDCMAHEVEYWQVDARNLVTGRCARANGDTAEEATDRCIKAVRKRV